MYSDYSNQSTFQAFTAQALTDDYTDSEFVFDVAGFTKVSLDVAYAMGASESANKLGFKLEHSTDGGVTWYSLVIDTTGTVSEIAARVWEITGDANLNVIVDIAYRKLKLSLIESGVASNAGAASVTVTVSGN